MTLALGILVHITALASCTWAGIVLGNRRWIRAAKTGELLTNDAGVFRVEKMTLEDPDPPGRERRPPLGVVFMQRVARRAFG